MAACEECGYIYEELATTAIAGSLRSFGPRYREVFDNFDPENVARYNAKKVRSLLADPGIIRNRLKVFSARRNARAWRTGSRRSSGGRRPRASCPSRPPSRG